MREALSISEINSYIKDIFSRDMILTDILAKGEISNYKPHYSGHMYFTLKDENSMLKCIMFKGNCAKLKFLPENGMKVIIRGYISVFERDGQYQLYGQDMLPDGIGALHLAFEQLKKKLEQEGLFAQERKKMIPFLPRTIGVVTSATGAVVKDIINVVTRRFPNIQIKIIPVAVQGESAPSQISKAIERLNTLSGIDIIIVARGGGSLEELWAFNEECVARAIAASTIPIISAVGHQTDFTIADFVADLRAPTPSSAAELAVPDMLQLKQQINVLNNRLIYAQKKLIDSKRVRLQRCKDNRLFKNPVDRINQERLRVDMNTRYMLKNFKVKASECRARLGSIIGKLDALSPLSIMSRGFCVATKLDSDKLIYNTREVLIGENIKLIMHDGSLSCVVNDREEQDAK